MTPPKMSTTKPCAISPAHNARGNRREVFRACDAHMMPAYAHTHYARPESDQHWTATMPLWGGYFVRQIRCIGLVFFDTLAQPCLSQ